MGDNADLVAERSPQFDEWLVSLRSARARMRVLQRIKRLLDGNPGLFRVVRRRILELKVDEGPGYRVYFERRNIRGKPGVLLLSGGDKSTQHRDVERAVRISRGLSGEFL